jgi:hypothetical protein
VLSGVARDPRRPSFFDNDRIDQTQDTRDTPTRIQGVVTLLGVFDTPRYRDDPFLGLDYQVLKPGKFLSLQIQLNSMAQVDISELKSGRTCLRVKGHFASFPVLGNRSAPKKCALSITFN